MWINFSIELQTFLKKTVSQPFSIELHLINDRWRAGKNELVVCVEFEFTRALQIYRVLTITDHTLHSGLLRKFFT